MYKKTRCSQSMFNLQLLVCLALIEGREYVLQVWLEERESKDLFEVTHDIHYEMKLLSFSSCNSVFLVINVVGVIYH